MARVNRDSTQIHVDQLGTATVMHEFMAVIFAIYTQRIYSQKREQPPLNNY
jgi:hypothetical protein